MSKLSPNDRSIVATWRKHGGMPMDPSTVDAAYRIVCKALDDVDELHAILAEVGWQDVPRAREALRFYADPANWKSPDPKDPDMMGAAEADVGEVARAALSESGGAT